MLDARFVAVAFAVGLAALPEPGPAPAASLPAVAPAFAPALFGSPLLCFPLDIGGAASLPFATEGFDVKTKMTPDEIATNLRSILSASDDVVVHMETIRRAAIWLISLKEEGRGAGDSQRSIAARLQSLLTDELLLAAAAAGGAVEGGTGDSKGGAPSTSSRPEALRWFDLGYFLATGGQAGFSDASRARVWLEKAGRLLPDEPALQFGIALAEFDHRSDGSGSSWARHLARLFEEPKSATAAVGSASPANPATRASPASPANQAALRKNVLATFGTFLGLQDWDKLGAEVRKQSGRS